MANVHFIGAGQMAEAIIRASLETGKLRAEEISLEDIDAGRIALLTERYGLVQERQSEHVLREASLVVLGIRPQDDLVGVAARIQPHLSAGTTVVSLIAGGDAAQTGSGVGSGKTHCPRYP